MKRIIPKQKELLLSNSIQYLHCKTQVWISEIDFIRVEQDFLKELLSEHIISLCDIKNFPKGKLLLNGIKHEIEIGENLIESIKEHKVNLALLLENIYLKREKLFRETNDFLSCDVKKYIDNFRNIKEQVFELVLYILKKKKKKVEK